MAKAKPKSTRNRPAARPRIDDDPARYVQSDYDPVERFEHEPGGRLYEPPAAPPPPGKKPQKKRRKVNSGAGAPEEYDWEEGKLFVMQELKTRGSPLDKNNQVKGWKSKSDVARLLIDHFEHLPGGKPGSGPDMSTARGKVSAWIKEFERGHN